MTDLPREDILENIMAQLYASNQLVGGKLYYQNPLYGRNWVSSPSVEEKAITAFKKILPLYSLNKLSTDQLTNNVIKKLNKAEKTIVISNGCCSMDTCPVKIFYDCIMEVLSHETS